MQHLGSPAYGALMLTGVAVTAAVWGRRARTEPALVMVYAFGLVGALLGAKLGYLVAEWPFRWGGPDVWLHALVGRTILGGLLGGYVGVEAGKRVVGHRGTTGDAFALIVPLGLALGRIGCYLNGCCLGVECEPAWWAVRDAAGTPRVPATLIEAVFHVAAFGVLLLLHRARLPALRGQLFHAYLIAYALFRIATEFVRETPRIGLVSTYQVLAALLLAFAAWRFVARRREQAGLGELLLTDALK